MSAHPGRDIFPRRIDDHWEAGLDLTTGQAEAGLLVQLRVHHADKFSLVTANIPAGVEHDMLVRLKGQGPAAADGTREDLYLRLNLSAAEPNSSEPTATAPTSPASGPVANAAVSEGKSDAPNSSGQLTAMLWVLFFLALGCTFWGANSSLVRNLENPTGTFLIESGQPWRMAATTEQQSVKGMYRFVEGRARLQFAGKATPVELRLTDRGGTSWGSKIEQQTLAIDVKGIAVPIDITSPNDPITLRFTVDVPNEPSWRGRSGTIACDFKIVFPWLVQGKDGRDTFENKRWSFSESFPVQFVPAGYVSLSDRVRWASGLLAVAVALFGLVRKFAGTKVQLGAALVLLAAGTGLYLQLVERARAKDAAPTAEVSPSP